MDGWNIRNILALKPCVARAFQTSYSMGIMRKLLSGGVALPS